MKELIIALDNMTKVDALTLAGKLKDRVWGFKVNDLLLEHGVEIIHKLSEYGNVFADSKLHDTPNTVYNSVLRLASAGASIITVHTSGGIEMLKYAVNASKSNEAKSTIAAVTTLTSLSNESVREIYRGYPLQRFIETLKAAGINTVVCSGNESEIYRTLKFKTICPGFRPFGPIPFDDQKRHTNIIDADYLVVGRPVTAHEDPIEAVMKIKEKLKAY